MALPGKLVIDYVFNAIQEKLASRYISDDDEYEELAKDCCGPGRPCRAEKEESFTWCVPFSSLRNVTQDHILEYGIPWREASLDLMYLEGAEGDPENFTDEQVRAIIDNVLGDKSRERWLENVPDVVELVKNDGKTSLDELMKRASAKLEIVEPETDHGMDL